MSIVPVAGTIFHPEDGKREDYMGGVAPLGQNFQTLSMSTLMRIGSSGGKLALPVHNGSIFAQFKHVEGVPAGNGPGYSVSKLQVLDILIERLVKLKEHSALDQMDQDPSAMSEQQLDAAIENLAHKLKTAAVMPANPADASMGPDFGMAVSQTGSVVSVLA